MGAHRSLRGWKGKLVAGLGVVGLALPAVGQPSGDRSVWPPGEAGKLLEGVCAASRRCATGLPARGQDVDARIELAEKLLELPTLKDGHSAADIARLGRLADDPAKRLEYAIGRAVELLGSQPKARAWDRSRVLEALMESLVVEYDAGYWSTLPDDLKRYERAIGSIGQSGEHVEVSLSVEIEESWPGGPTYLLDAHAEVQNGPATHFRMWCALCESISSTGEWQEWAEWTPIVIVVGAGYKNICLEVRAEPYQSNWANTAVACDALGTPPAPEDEEEDVADSNNPVQRCFGAIGNNCGAADEEGFDYGHCLRLHPFTDPDVATCQINGGSWEHDECCIEKRVGGNAPESEQGSCSPPMAVALSQPYVCEAEFNKAVARLAQNLTWVRDVDATVENTSGVVDFSRYCALAGSIVHQSDVNYCCSREAEPYVQSAVDALVDERRVCL